MITYEDALRIAKELKPNANHCIEYENGYIFCNESDDEGIGSEYVPCVVLKMNGKVVSMPYFVAYGAGKEIKEFNI